MQELVKYGGLVVDPMQLQREWKVCDALLRFTCPRLASPAAGISPRVAAAGVASAEHQDTGQTVGEGGGRGRWHLYQIARCVTLYCCCLLRVILLFIWLCFGGCRCCSHCRRTVLVRSPSAQGHI